jgi:hypothetical protein
MKRTQRRVWLAGAAAAVLTVTLLPPGTAAAQPGPQVTVEVVASGLDVPRGLAYDKLLGRVLVAESGNSEGNNGACSDLSFGGTLFCYGETGAVFQYSERWWLPTERIAEGLPSIWAPEIASIYEVVLGLHDVELPFFTGPVVGVFGLSGPLEFRDELEASHPRAAELATAGWIHSSGQVTPFADLAQFEQDQNPDPDFLDSDPFGVEIIGLKAIVAEAAGNFIGEVGLLGGDIDVLAVLPGRFDPAINDVRESVPTTVVRGPDGALYIGELSGAFAPVGFARVWRLDSQGDLTVFADGFTGISDITFDHRGRLVVLEIARNGFYQNPRPDGDRIGRLVRVENNGSHTVLLQEPLENPGGVVAAKRGVFYITNKSATLGGTGELLKVTVSG